MRHALADEFPVAALTMVLAQRQPAPGVLHHSDRGSQPGFNWSSQQWLNVWNVGADPAPGLVFSNRGSSEAWC